MKPLASILRVRKTCAPRLLALSALTLAVVCFAAPRAPQELHTAGLTVHEWGTFTGIAGGQGKAIEWTAYGGAEPFDLPRFVEHLSTATFKTGLRGTIRMETPVMYFYSPQEVTVSVRVGFSQGLITEWYPHAAMVQPHQVPPMVDLGKLPAGGSIEWDNVTVSPNLSGEFPRQDAESRYYAARETASAPLFVNAPSGDQQEKFLFYRGVSAAALPFTAGQNAKGGLLVKSLSGERIPALVYFERRGNQVGYRWSAAGSEVPLEAPVLDADLDSLCDELRRVLIDQGLYPDEAQAMLATWRDSWFEEGSRLIYIVPRGFVDKLLPLAIDPAPAQLVRVFVGRLEIVSPATVQEVAAAVKTHNGAILKKYGRFLEPILQIARAELAYSGCTSAGGK